MGNHKTGPYDANLQFKDAGLVAASAAATVSAAAKIVDVGAGMVHLNLVCDVTAIEIASDDELYTILVQGSNSATFASGVDTLAAIHLGAKEVIPPATVVDVDSSAQRYVTPFTNEKGGTIYRYLRVYTVVAGDVATGINYTAFGAAR